MKRIFISSVQKEFAKERAFLKRYIEGNPVLRRFFTVFAFELDVPAKDKTAKEVFVSELKKSDVYVCLIGSRYGTEDKNGVSPTEVEFDTATKLRLPRLVFVKDDAGKGREEKENQFLLKVSKALSWVRFSGSEDLLAEVYASLDDLIVSEGHLKELPFDATPCGHATMESISRVRVREFIALARDRRGLKLPLRTPAAKVLEHFHLTGESGALTNSAVLLFGRDPQAYFPTSHVKCIAWPTSERHKPIRDHLTATGTLFEMADAATDFVLDKLEKRIGTREEGRGATAPMWYDIPKSAVKEAIVNAIVHRDYWSSGSVQVELFPDRLCVMSPGLPHPSADIRRFATTHSSFPVNPLIAEALYQTGHIERMGTGLEDLFRECRNAGLPRPKVEVFGAEFHLTLFRNRQEGKGDNKGDNKGGNKGDNRTTNRSQELTERQTQILGILREEPRLSIRVLARRLGIRSNSVDKQISVLKDMGLVQRCGGTHGFWEVLS